MGEGVFRIVWIGAAGKRPQRVALVLAMAAGSMLGTDGFAQDANGFLRAEGEGDVAVSFTTDSYDRFWRGTTEVSNPGLGEVTTDSLALWLAYGLSGRLTMEANLPYVRTEGDGTANFEDDGLQDASFLFKYRFASVDSGRHDFVGGFGLRTVASDYEANAPVDIGDGTTDWLLRFIYQFNAGAFYASQQVGFDLRNEDAPNGYPLYTEIGYTFAGRFTLSGGFQCLEAGGGTDIGDPGFTFPGNEEEYRRAGVKGFWRLTDALGVAAAASTTLGGRNTGDTKGVSLGMNYHY